MARRTSVGLAILGFLICMNYYILRNLKDSLVLTEALSGTEALPFLKTWALLPVTIILVALTIRLSNRMPFPLLFLGALTGFTAFYALFTFVIYPLGDTLHPHFLADRLQLLLPSGWRGFVAIIRYWPSSLFYVMAESWAFIIWYILFSGFANETMNSSVAKAGYPWIILAGNLAAFAAGTIVPMITTPDWYETLSRLTILLMAVSFSAGVVFVLIQKPKTHALSNLYTMSFSESLKSLLQSRYLLCLAFVVIGFNLIINLTEVIWKNEVLKLYPHPSDYNAYMNRATALIGILSIIMTLFAARFHKMEWTHLALVTPLMTLGTALIFFLPLMFSMTLIPAFLAGTWHIVLSRSSRYTLFDMTKELALIPLPSDQKFKAKTHIDGIGSRLGKGLSSGIYQGMFLFLPAVSACVPVIFILLIVVAVFSIVSIRAIGRQMEAAVDKV